MKYIIYFLLFILLSFNVAAYDKIIEFDNNEDIIVTTTVYNTSRSPCLVCTCNLTIYNPSPNENFINISILMNNNANGIYSANISNFVTLAVSSNIYPITLVCNDSSGFMGGDTREGIKVSETLFDYTSGILALLGVGVALLVMSFKIDPEFANIKKVCFFGSFVFFFSTLGTAFFILKNSPNSGPFVILFETSIFAFLMILLAVLYLYFFERLKKPIDIISKGRF